MTNSTTDTAPTTSPAPSPTSKSPDRLVWIDCEMTGLDLDRDELVEIAVVITDYDLNVQGPGLDIIIKPNDSALENMGDFVRAMHTSSGLITEIPNGVSAAEAEFQVLEYVLKYVPADQKALAFRDTERSEVVGDEIF